MRILFYCMLLLVSSVASAKQILNVYNWADYMPANVIKQFESETDIQVNYTEYDSNETLYAKLKSNSRLGYDVIFPSSYYVHRMRREGMLLALDKNKLPNFKYLNKSLLNQNFDPNNTYSIPYLWGTTAIVVNSKYLSPQTVTSWKDFWNPKFKNQLLLFDDMREVFALALFRLGYSINDTNPQHIEQAYQQLKKLWENVKLFSSEAEQNIYIDEDVYIGMGLNGEIFNAMSENPSLVYIYPTDGFEIWMDNIAIPINAPHLKEALLFIDFLMRPEIAKQISTATGFSTPNQAAIALLPEKMRKSYIVNPDNKILQRGQFLLDLGEVNAIYEQYWNMLKIGE
ncbi:MAG: spermidine/putrescine ABC transporter substrate-binding protein [Gammaproteobacteria bacterium]|nr:spermidine/putrescine ABC transporter substrate-binding protein [Gammaproteobacteria bacterium]